MLSRDMQCSFFGASGRYRKEKTGCRVPVEMEACYTAARSNEHFVEPVYVPAIAGNVQCGGEGTAYQPAFSAGFAKAPGSPPGSGGLPYGLRHTAEEVMIIAAIADDITELAGKGEQGGLFCHRR